MIVTAAHFAELQRKAALYDQMAAAAQPQRLALANFALTLEECISDISKHVWINDKTLRPATSVDAALRALDYHVKKPWNDVRNCARTFDSYHLRWDLPNGSRRGTICIDLRDIEAFCLRLQPKVGLRVLTAFKKEHGIVTTGATHAA